MVHNLIFVYYPLSRDGVTEEDVLEGRRVREEHFLESLRARSEGQAPGNTSISFWFD